jgi:8-oxo-dGTP pyrophosphatase MutT (NUDIX family)
VTGDRPDFGLTSAAFTGALVLGSFVPVTRLRRPTRPRASRLPPSIQHGSGRRAALTDCVSALYTDRMRPGGRIDRWYRPGARLGGIRAAALSGYRLVVNGRQYRLDLAELIAWLRVALTHGQWQTSVSQGDPTEPNIAYPLCWLDFEHAGRNSLAGDAAILVWYLLGMGGWLVPTYRPATYRRTLRRPLPPVATPTVRNLDVSHRRRHVSLDYSWTVGPGRQMAIATVRSALAGDLGAAITAGDVLAALRPMLAVRILTVISLTEMTAPDAMLCLAKLAEIVTDEQDLDQILAGRSCADGGADVRDRVRAILITPNGELLTIRRERPGMDVYWVLPGGGVEPADASPEDALRREIREELAADITIDRLTHVLEEAGERQLFYLARVNTWSSADRTGPEFSDPTRGSYHIDTIPLTVDALAATTLKPVAVADVLVEHLRHGRDLFALPDLRTDTPAHDKRDA